MLFCSSTKRQRQLGISSSVQAKWYCLKTIYHFIANLNNIVEHHNPPNLSDLRSDSAVVLSTVLH